MVYIAEWIDVRWGDMVYSRVNRCKVRVYGL